MPNDDVARIEAVTRLIEAVGSRSDAVTLKALEAAGPQPPDQTTSNRLWRWLVGGLLAVVGTALLATIYLVADQDPDTGPEVVITIFTTTLAGLIGLFSQSPASS